MSALLIFLVIFSIFVVGSLFNGAILFLVKKIFRVPAATFYKSLTIILVYLVISLIIIIPLSIINFAPLTMILPPFILLACFIFFFRRYYQLDWVKSLLIYFSYTIIQTVIGLLLAFILILPLKAYVFQLYAIDGNSMNPTLQNGEMFVSLKFDHDYHRQDIVVIEDTDTNRFIVQRIIGLPGEEISIKDNQVLINGNILSEDYIQGETTGDISIRLKDNEYFLMGDNRSDSQDSRITGPINGDNIVGKYYFSYCKLSD